MRVFRLLVFLVSRLGVGREKGFCHGRGNSNGSSLSSGHWNRELRFLITLRGEIRGLLNWVDRLLDKLKRKTRIKRNGNFMQQVREFNRNNVRVYECLLKDSQRIELENIRRFFAGNNEKDTRLSMPVAGERCDLAVHSFDGGKGENQVEQVNDEERRCGESELSLGGSGEGIGSIEIAERVVSDQYELAEPFYGDFEFLDAENKVDVNDEQLEVFVQQDSLGFAQSEDSGDQVPVYDEVEVDSGLGLGGETGIEESMGLSSCTDGGSGSLGMDDCRGLSSLGDDGSQLRPWSGRYFGHGDNLSVDSYVKCEYGQHLGFSGRKSEVDFYDMVPIRHEVGVDSGSGLGWGTRTRESKRPSVWEVESTDSQLNYEEISLDDMRGGSKLPYRLLLAMQGT